MTSALRLLQHALRKDPDNKKCIVLLKKVKKFKRLKDAGSVAFKRGDFRSAISLFTDAIAVDPTNLENKAKLHANRAAAYLGSGDHALAVQDCDSALEIKPGYLKVLLRRAKARQALGDYEQAVHDLERAHRIDSTDQSVRRLLMNARREAKKASRPDYYKILGIAHNATDADIRKNYKRLALQHHPDKQGDEEMFKKICQAYQVLKDPQKRRRYDSGADLEDIGMGPRADFDPTQIFQMFFSGGGGGGASFRF